VLCLTSCCSVVLQDPNCVFPIGSGLDGLYSSLSPVLDFILLCACCSIALQDPNRVFPIGSGLDGLYSSLSLVVDFVPLCALALLVFQFHRLHWFSCRASRPSALAFAL
jgi:hypothetical protein